MSKKGFTLIELLVVISIIGLLSSVVLASLNVARMKSRDTRRISDLHQIRVALDMYFSDNGYYPAAPGGYDSNSYNYSYNGTWDTLATALSPYIKNLPKDPINSSCPPFDISSVCYSYTYGNVGRNTHKSQYDLTARLEDPDNPLRCSVKNYRFFWDGVSPWCGSYSGQLYEASPD